MTLRSRQVYDGTRDDDPQSHTYSQSAGVKSFYGSSYFGTVVSPGVTTMQVPATRCSAVAHSLTRAAQDVLRGQALLQRQLGLQQQVLCPPQPLIIKREMNYLIACACRDKQDWKREGGFFYALYNGANYYRCNGTWGISISRSSSAVGPECAPTAFVRRLFAPAYAGMQVHAAAATLPRHCG